MFRERGVVQVPAIGANPMHVARTKDGVVAFELRINACLVSPEMEEQILHRLATWLDRIDPPLRVVKGGAPLPSEPR